MSSKTYFISGANRGIGLQLVEQLVNTEKDVQIIATARNPEQATELIELKNKFNNIDIVKLDISSEDSLQELDSQMQKIGKDGIDILISNAAIADSYYEVKDAPRDVWLNHYKTNVLGPIRLYQILYTYLLKKQTRQIIFVSSIAGSIGAYFPLSCSAYGLSKAALNFVAKEVSSELDAENFTVVALHPGNVSTDMGNYGYSNFSEELQRNIKDSYISPVESAEKQLKIFRNLTRESNGKFLSYDGSEIKW